MGTPLNDLPRYKLREIVATYGRDICNDPLRCRGLLLDLCGQYKREVNILVTSLEEKVPIDILSSSIHTPYAMLQGRLTQRLYENRGLDEDFARWGVDSWALALGIISQKDLLQKPTNSNQSTDPTIQARRPGAMPPRPPLIPPVSARPTAVRSTPPIDNMRWQRGAMIAPRASPPVKRKSGSAIALVCVAVALICSAILLIFFTVRNSAQNAAIATATALANATAFANATATAINTDSYGPYNRVALSDPLVDNSRGYGWNDPDCQFTNGIYSTRSAKNNLFTFCVASKTSFGDFAYQLQIKIVTGDKGCLFFHFNATKGQVGHAFCVGSDGTYLFMNDHEDTLTYDVAERGSSSAIIRGLNQTNVLGVLVQGNQITLYVNKMSVLHVNDPNPTVGPVGVGALDENNATEVVFSNARVWTN